MTNGNARNYLPKHADVVIAYAVKHNYPEIIGEAALLLLDKPLAETAARLPANLVIPWVIGNLIACFHIAIDNGTRSVITTSGTKPYTSLLLIHLGAIIGDIFVIVALAAE